MPTQIQKRQIADGAISKEKIPAGAGIETSKLADGGKFLQSGGTVAMAANLPMGGFKITGLGAGSDPSDGVTLSQMQAAVDALNTMFDSKGSAVAATTGNISIANPGTAIFDGITLAAGERLLVRAQTLGAENGLYVFNGSAVALTRTDDMNDWAEVPGALVVVEQGTTYADSLWLNTSDRGGTLGTTVMTWYQIPFSNTGLQNTNFVTREVPAGLLDGTNVTFTLANTPVLGSEEVFLNGILQDMGASNDYTISAATLTFIVAPLAGEKILVSYRK